METPEVFFLGKILRRHGLKGHWMVQTNTTEVVNYLNSKSLFVGINGLYVPFFIQGHEIISSNRLLIQFSDDLFNKEDLTHRPLYAPLNHFPYVLEHDCDDPSIIGFDVRDVHKGHIGTLRAIHKRSFQKLLDIRFETQQIWVPMVKEFIVEINRKEQFLLLNCPEGLLDLYI